MLKAVVLNTLYGTNTIAIRKVGEHLERFLNEIHPTGPELVERLVDEIRNVTKRSNHVFAAKYAHFFINPNLPILDQYAERMVAKHIGRIQGSQNPKRYLRFAEDLEKLRGLAGLTCDCAQLDAYLWVAGEYWRWKEDPQVKISADLKLRFERLSDSEGDRTLRTLLGISVRND
jgi:hypothetical protein